jgi:hypothetical protein
LLVDRARAERKRMRAARIVQPARAPLSIRHASAHERDYYRERLAATIRGAMLGATMPRQYDHPSHR